MRQNNTLNLVVSSLIALSGISCSSGVKKYDRIAAPDYSVENLANPPTGYFHPEGAVDSYRQENWGLRRTKFRHVGIGEYAIVGVEANRDDGKNTSFGNNPISEEGKRILEDASRDAPKELGYLLQHRD